MPHPALESLRTLLCAAPAVHARPSAADRQQHYRLFELSVCFELDMVCWRELPAAALAAASRTAAALQARGKSLRDYGVDCASADLRRVAQAKWYRPGSQVSFTACATFMALSSILRATELTLVTSEGVSLCPLARELPGLKHTQLSDRRLDEICWLAAGPPPSALFLEPSAMPGGAPDEFAPLEDRKSLECAPRVVHEGRGGQATSGLPERLPERLPEPLAELLSELLSESAPELDDWGSLPAAPGGPPSAPAKSRTPLEAKHSRATESAVAVAIGDGKQQAEGKRSPSSPGGRGPPRGEGLGLIGGGSSGRSAREARHDRNIRLIAEFVAECGRLPGDGDSRLDSASSRLVFLGNLVKHFRKLNGTYGGPLVRGPFAAARQARLAAIPGWTFTERAHANGYVLV